MKATNGVLRTVAGDGPGLWAERQGGSQDLRRQPGQPVQEWIAATRCTQLCARPAWSLS